MGRDTGPSDDNNIRQVHAVKSETLKDRTARLLERGWFRISLYTLIVLNVISVITESVTSVYEANRLLFDTFELVSVAIFSIEYLIRLWACTAKPEYRRPVVGRILYVLSPLAIIDLVAILPFYLPMLFAIDLRFVRILRLFRMFRILKLGRYSKSLRVLLTVLRNKREELAITLFALVVLIVLAACLMYFAEEEAQPEVFTSIPETMWLAVITLTTVGYGDLYPVTIAGKFLAAVIAMLGIGIFALPAGILSAGFVEETSKSKAEPKYCPNCGEKLE